MVKFNAIAQTDGLVHIRLPSAASRPARSGGSNFMHLQLCLNLPKLDSLKMTPIYILPCPELQLNCHSALQYCLLNLTRVGQQNTVRVMNDE